MRHLRFAIRNLMGNPAFTVTALITLALGMGANGAMFSATNSLLLKPLPYPEADRIVSLQATTPKGGTDKVSLLNLLDWQEQCAQCDHMAAFRRRSFGLRPPGSDDSLAVVQTGMVTNAFFSVLGTRPMAGRFFTWEEEERDEKVIVLSDKLQRQFGGPSILGKSLRVNEVAYTVIGLLPSAFSFPMDGRVIDAYIPLNHKSYGKNRSLRSMNAIARLTPAANHSRTRTELSGIARRMEDAYPAANKGYGIDMVGLQEALRGQNRKPLLLLMGAGLLLLLIACTNVVNLLMGRFLARSREVAIRTVLGASTGRLARQFLVEGLVLSLAGAMLALVVAHGCLLLLPLALPLLGGSSPVPDLPLDQLQLDLSTCLFTFATALASTLVFALVPSLLARKADLQPLLKGQMGNWSARMRGLLVTVQIGLSTVLLLCTGLLLRSFLAVMATDPGFDSTSVKTFGLGIPESRYNTDEKMLNFHQRLIDELSAIPGVDAVGGVGRLPTTGSSFKTRFQPEGAGLPARQRSTAAINIYSPDYLATMKIPLLAGRSFTNLDVIGNQRVLLVNRAFQRAFFGGQSALGKRLELSWRNGSNPAGVPWEIVGITGDTRQASLEKQAEPEIYLPLFQFPIEGLSYTLQTRRNDPALGTAVQAAITRVDSQLEQVHLKYMDHVLNKSMGNRRLALILTALFATVAALVTGVGIYGVIAYHVGQRRRELVIRMILGGRARGIRNLILKQGLVLAGWGIASGLFGFFFAGRLLAGQLYGLTALDPLTIFIGSGATLILALGASWVPAWRITQTPLVLSRSS